MAINALIAQGVTPLGEGLPQTFDSIQRNALLQQQMGLQQQQANTQNSLAQAQLGQITRNNGLQDKALADKELNDNRDWAATSAQILASVKDPAQFSHIADSFAADPRAQKLGIKREMITPEGVQGFLAQTQAAAGQLPYEQTTQYKQVQAQAEVGKATAATQHGYRMSEIAATGDQARQTQGAKQHGSVMTPEGVDLAAQEYLSTGKLPPGMGGAATGINARVIDRAAQISAANGNDAQAATLHRASFIAAKTAQAALTKQRTMVGAFERTALKNLEIALDESEKVDRGGVPVLNRWLNAGKKNIAGDPEIARFHTALTSALNEYAKVLSGATGSAGISDAARREAESLLSTANTKEQVRGIADIMRREMANREAGFSEQEAQLQETMSGKPSVAVAPAAGGAPAAPGAPLAPSAETVQTATGPGGKKLYLRNNQWVEQ